MENTILRTSFWGYKKEDVLARIDTLNLFISEVETGNIPREYAEKEVNRIMLIGMQTDFNGFNKDDTDEYLDELISRITNKEYHHKHKSDHIAPIKQFFKDTWKVLLAIFIVTASLLYVLIFDGSEIPFIVTFIACIAILFVKALKSLINTIIVFFRLKKSGVITGENKGENAFWRAEFEIRIALFLLAGWFLANMISICFRGS